MSGATFVKFLENCIDQLNDPENNMPLSIPSAYEATTYYIAQMAYETFLKDYEDMMNESLNAAFPILWNEFDMIHIGVFEIVEKGFVKKIVVSSKQIKSFQEKFYERISNLRNQFYQVNSKAIYDHNNKCAHELWEEHVKHGLIGANLFVIIYYVLHSLL